MEMPVYLFTGFLDAGKTKFIQETLEDPRFYDGERTLVILCEEGEEEFAPDEFPSDAVFFHTIENVEQLKPDYFMSLQKKYRVQRVLIEYNGMWMLDSLYSNLPETWTVYQEISFADSTTYLAFNSNMRNLVADKLKNCEMIIFNRVKLGSDTMQYHKIVRGITRRANIAYEFTDGNVEYDEIEDPLPFDINADSIKIEDKDYALWFRDIMEEQDKYNEKTVSFKGIVANDGKLPKESFAVGRHIMTCCVQDISFGGLVAKWENSSQLKTRDWIYITAKIKIEYNAVYKSKGPVLYALSVEHALPPEQELATFY